MSSIFTQYDAKFKDVCDLIDPNDFQTAYAGTLSGIKGRNNQSTQHNSCWKTAVSYLVSLAHYTTKGTPYAPGNPHVCNTNHAVNGNAHTVLNNLSSTQLAAAVRSLFTFAEVQQRGYATYSKYLGIIDTVNNQTHLIKMKWHHTIITDDIVVDIKTFDGAVPVQNNTINDIINTFAALGFA